MSEEKQIVLLDIYHSILVNLSLIDLILSDNEKIANIKKHYEELKIECEETLYRHGVEPEEKVSEQELAKLKEKVDSKDEQEKVDLAELFYVFSKADRDNIKQRLAAYRADPSIRFILNSNFDENANPFLRG